MKVFWELRPSKYSSPWVSKYSNQDTQQNNLSPAVPRRPLGTGSLGGGIAPQILVRNRDKTFAFETSWIILPLYIYPSGLLKFPTNFCKLHDYVSQEAIVSCQKLLKIWKMNHFPSNSEALLKICTVIHSLIEKHFLKICRAIHSCLIGKTTF